MARYNDNLTLDQRLVEIENKVQFAKENPSSKDTSKTIQPDKENEHIMTALKKAITNTSSDIKKNNISSAQWDDIIAALQNLAIVFNKILPFNVDKILSSDIINLITDYYALVDESIEKLPPYKLLQTEINTLGLNTNALNNHQLYLKTYQKNKIQNQIEFIKSQTTIKNKVDIEQLKNNEKIFWEDLNHDIKGIQTLGIDTNDLNEQIEELTNEYTLLYKRITPPPSFSKPTEKITVKKLQEENTALINQNKTLQNENTELKEINTNKETMIDLQRKKNTSLISDYDKCKDDKKKMLDEINILENNNTKLLEDLEAKKIEIANYEEASQIGIQNNENYLQCITEKQNLEKKIKICEDSLKEKEEEYVKLNDELNQIELELDHDKEVINQQQIQIQQAEDQIQQIGRESNEKDKKINLLKSEIIPVQENERILNEQNERLTQNLLLLEKEKRDAIAESEIAKKNLEVELSSGRQQYLAAYIETDKNLRTLPNQQIQKLQTEIETLKEEKKVLETKNANVNNEQILNLQQQILNLQNNCALLLQQEEAYKKLCEEEKEKLKQQTEECDKKNEEMKREREKCEKEKEELQKKLDENNARHQEHEKTIETLNLEIKKLKDNLEDQPAHLIQTHPDANELTKKTEELEKVQKVLHDCKETEEKYKAALKQKDDEINSLLNQNTPKTETTQTPPLSNKDKLKIYTDDHLQKGTYLSESNGFIHLQIPSDDDLPRRHILFKKTPEETSVYEPLFSDSNGIHYLTIQSENTFKKNYNALSSDVFSVCHLTPQPDFLTQNTIFKQYKKNLVLKDFYPLQNNAESTGQNIFFYDHAFPLVFGAPAEPFRKLWLKGLHRTDFDDIGQTLNAGLRYFFSPSLAYAIECGVLADFAYSSSNPSQYVIHLHFLARPKTLQMLRKDKKDNIQPRKIRKTPLLEVTPVFLRKTSYSEEEERDIEEFSVYMHDWYIRFSEKAHLYPD